MSRSMILLMLRLRKFSAIWWPFHFWFVFGFSEIFQKTAIHLLKKCMFWRLSTINLYVLPFSTSMNSLAIRLLFIDCPWFQYHGVSPSGHQDSGHSLRRGGVNVSQWVRDETQISNDLVTIGLGGCHHGCQAGRIWWVVETALHISIPMFLLWMVKKPTMTTCQSILVCYGLTFIGWLLLHIASL